MNRERLSEDVYVFTSERYAQVTASLIVSGTYGILIDTLPFPDESLQVALFAKKTCPDGVRYVIFTQHQADHTYGAFLFPRAEIIAHTQCRQILIDKGYTALDEAKRLAPELAPVRLRLPTMTFDTGSAHVRLPGKTLEIFATPGHTADSVSVLLHEERILFAGDTFMAIPTISEGEPAKLKDSIERIGAMQLDTIVQGHGEIIMRGEIKDNVRRSMNYIDMLTSKIQKLVEDGAPRSEARAITIEQCGLQRVLLNGMVVPLHAGNALAYYDRLVRERGGLPRPKAVTPAAGAPPAPPLDAKKPAANASKPAVVAAPTQIAPAAAAAAPEKPAPPAPRPIPVANPVATRPAGAKPVAEKPTSAKPAAEKATSAKPATKPAAGRRTPGKPIAAKPAAKPAAGKRTAAKLVAAKPAAKPASKKPTKPARPAAARNGRKTAKKPAKP